MAALRYEEEPLLSDKFHTLLSVMNHLTVLPFSE